MSSNNTFSGEISQRYALALYELAKEQNLVEECLSNILIFKKMFNSNEDLKNFIKNPTYSNENQKIVFEKISKLRGINNIVKNFLLTLVIKKRIFFLDIVIEEFLKLIAYKRGEVSANLISSKKLDPKTIKDMENEISKNINRSIQLNYKIDESLIGGVIIQIGSLMIDTSIKNKLQKYKKLMAEV